ncbi:thiamine pyrophosphate-binding protein [Providencia rettgeri]|uniref:thiamine pyrophosphate-binding protein n=1 Tax=Providencia TaxID=586 RepID=UPI001CFDEACA|nr:MULTISPECIES: thiamine pyrophosphate-binding protein [Providencia]EIU7555415.1 thiamine pyrophosphate-binding protein [Providencia rettgeri]EJD6498813.1 thiamine pyrophosphate-binding protein [Providencia rettgeri]EJD6642681.1 thiamine pyrophosphate-binding protein [Providencia rettgeri]ELL9152289.1 thiamine pyrophosphate-binding protein [Providencia rettgeri]ELR5047053.1 thiamine pyrophosphate-binding protein [Providencia rettgeri]
MSEMITVGEAIARTLEQYQVTTVYGVISIHNLPIADAIGRRAKIDFTPSRGEAGAVTMADAHSRFSGLGVALTSTGAGAGNAVGSMIEAMNACSPMLHITGQVEKAYLDMDAGFIHETADQLGFLRSSSKQAFRVHTPEQAVATLHKAIQVAQTAPCGPVSIEIPIDIQSAQVPLSLLSAPLSVPTLPAICSSQIEAIWDKLQHAQRPLLWVGGGALQAVEAVKRLANQGVAVISSTHGRGILSDDHPFSLRAFHNADSIETLMRECDLTLVAGSRLRSNETKTWSLPLPHPIIQIDINPLAANRNYLADLNITGDCKGLLNALADKIEQANRPVSSVWKQQIQQAVQLAEQQLRAQCGPYSELSDAVEQALPEHGIFVRDITVSGSLWGSRLLKATQPMHNIHSLAGAIGLGLAMAIGSAKANPNTAVIGLVGDGGLMLGVGELATMAQEQLPIVLIIMNDQGYGVMRGIQEKYFSGRQYYNELLTPSFSQLAQSMGITALTVDKPSEFQPILHQAVALKRPVVVEVLMNHIGKMNFSGPPQKKLF